MEGVYTVIGISHQAAPVSVRESLAIKPEEKGALNTQLAHECSLSDVVILSTCSRFEVYGTMTEAEEKRVLNWFQARSGRDLRDYIYIHRGQMAMNHILRVSGGLDSWIIGETEILGQLKSAYQDSCKEGTASRNSHLTFQHGLKIGKRIRNETGIVGGIASIGGAASIMARRIFNNLKDKKVLIFGAGTMAESTVRHLCAKGVKNVWVANRSVDKAEKLAVNLGGTPLSLDEGFEKLAEADIAVFSTGASKCIFNKECAESMSKKRGGRTVFLIDLGLPRNVASNVTDAAGMYLYDMDDLKRIVHESMEKRSSDTKDADKIVGEEALSLWERLEAPPRPKANIERPKPSKRAKFAEVV
jgi:glutamyl-tRNA reductase